MTNNFLTFIRGLVNMKERDVFKRTQNRLTRIYSGLLILFLALFIAIVYSVIYVTILKNQEHELQSLVNQEASFMDNQFSNKKNFQGSQNQEIVFAGVNQFFYYLVGSNGDIIMGSEADHRLRPDLLNLINKGMNRNGEIQKETLHVRNFSNRNGSREEFHPHEGVNQLRLMIASQPIYNKGQYIGQLYVGKDISFAYQLFHTILIILFVLGILFFGGALFMSVGMSKRAMVPISRAFLRQREFVGDASHELRTPLSVLLSSLDAMEMTIDAKKEDFAGKLLTNMRQEVKRMTNLVSDLLTLARSDSDKIELRREVFDFRPQAEKVIESVFPLAAAKDIKLNLSAPHSLQAVGDPERISQLLYILMDNAIKYTPNNGEIHLSLSEESNHLSITVQDTGIGIKKEDFKRIFERFYRSDKSRSRQMRGHGLGLSIAKWIVETHNGTIKVNSEVGKGSTFIVRIPNAIRNQPSSTGKN